MTGARHRWVALYVLCTGMLMIVLDVTVVNVALPYIEADLHFTAAALAWVLNAYLISFAGLLLLSGRLGDLLGRPRVFLAGLAVFVVSSAACGLATGPAFLVAARFVQGAGGALTSAGILGMIVTMFPEPREQARAIGVFAFVASAGGAVGLLAGGVLTQLIDWHWIFVVNVPIGLLTLATARRLVPDERGPGLRRGLDIAGAGLATAALMLGVYTVVGPGAQQGWTAWPTVRSGLGALAMGALFILREHLGRTPLLPLRVLRSRTIAVANVVQVFGAAGMFGTFFLGALYAQRVLHYGPLTIGMAFLPISVLMGGISVWWSEALVHRFGGRRLVVGGLILIALALGLLARAPADGRYWSALFTPFVLLGIGAGLCFPPLMGLAMSGAPAEDAGLASGLINTTGQAGGALGLAVLAAASAGRSADLQAAGAPLGSALTGGYHLGFWISAGFVAAGAALAMALGDPAVPQVQAVVDTAEPASSGDRGPQRSLVDGAVAELCSVQLGVHTAAGE